MLRKPRNRRRVDVWLILCGLVFVVVGAGFFVRTMVLPMWRVQAAGSWQSTSCHVERAEIVAGKDSDGDPEYRAVVRYRYEVAGRSYTGTRIDFRPDHTASKRADAEAWLPSSTTVPCWYDPDDPATAVLAREGWPGSVAFLPLVFVAGGWLAWREAFPVRTRQRRGKDGRIVVTRRNAEGAIALLAATFALGFVPFGLLATVTDPWPGIIWGVLAIGLGLLAIVLVCKFLTKVTVELAGEVRAGESVALQITARTPFARPRVAAKLVGNEHCEWREGSSPRIDLHHLQTLAATEQAVRIPDDALPSVDEGDNKIRWHVEVTAEIPMWPDLDLEVPIDVRGANCTRERPAAAATSERDLPITLERDTFAPGDTIRGTLAWSRDAAPKTAKVLLVWTSTSRHSTHREIVGEAQVADLPVLVRDAQTDPYRSGGLREELHRPLAARDRRRLEFTAPDRPYSYEGRLVTFRWQLELVLDGETISQPIRIDGRG